MSAPVSGWKLVPVDATEAMIKAGAIAIMHDSRGVDGVPTSVWARDCIFAWHAMVDAAPVPPAPQEAVDARGDMDCYDAGLLNGFGGGNVEWWQDYIRAELGRADDFYQLQHASRSQS